jgi:hypothetical protein
MVTTAFMSSASTSPAPKWQVHGPSSIPPTSLSQHSTTSAFLICSSQDNASCGTARSSDKADWFPTFPI